MTTSIVGVGAYAALSAMVGVGTVCGTLLFGHLQPRRRRGVISYWLWLINSLAIAGLALAPWYLLAGGLALVRGVCIGFGVAVWETMLQEMVPARLLGTSDQPRFLRQLRPDADRARNLGRDRRNRPAGADDRRWSARLGGHDHGRADASLAPSGRMRRPVYWKPRYATRGQRHRAWVKQQARREAALRKESQPSLFSRLAARLRRNS
jgi:hypothetical protein